MERQIYPPLIAGARRPWLFQGYLLRTFVLLVLALLALISIAQRTADAASRSKDAVYVWLRELDSPDARKRFLAAHNPSSLQLLSSRAASRVAADYLSKARPFARAAIANAFGETRVHPDLSVPALIRTLRRCEPEVCLHASLALIKIGDAAVRPLVSELRDMFRAMQEHNFSNVMSYTGRIGNIRYILETMSSVQVVKEMVSWLQARRPHYPASERDELWNCSDQYTIVGFQHEHEAKAFLDDLKQRMRAYKKTCSWFWPERLSTSLLQSQEGYTADLVASLLHGDDPLLHRLAIEAMPRKVLSKEAIETLSPFAFREKRVAINVVLILRGQQINRAQDILREVAVKHPDAEVRSYALSGLLKTSASVTFLINRLRDDPSDSVKDDILTRFERDDDTSVPTLDRALLPVLIQMLEHSDTKTRKVLWKLIDAELQPGWEDDASTAAVVRPAVVSALGQPDATTILFGRLSRIVVGLERDTPEITAHILRLATMEATGVTDERIWPFSHVFIPILKQLKHIRPEEMQSILDLALRNNHMEDFSYLLDALPTLPTQRDFLIARLEHGVLSELRQRLVAYSGANEDDAMRRRQVAAAFTSGWLALAALKPYSDAEAMQFFDRTFSSERDSRTFCDSFEFNKNYGGDKWVGREELETQVSTRCHLALRQTAGEVQELAAALAKLGDDPRANPILRTLSGPGSIDILWDRAFDKSYAHRDTAVERLIEITKGDPTEQARLFDRLLHSKTDNLIITEVIRALFAGPVTRSELPPAGRSALISLIKRLDRKEFIRYEHFIFSILESRNYTPDELAPLVKRCLRSSDMQEKALLFLKRNPSFASAVQVSLRRLLFAATLEIRAMAAEVLFHVGALQNDFEFGAFALGEQAQDKRRLNAIDLEAHEIEGYRSHETSGRTRTELPPFPWPPPKFAHIAAFGRDVPRQYLGSEDEPLGTVYQHIYSALKAVDTNFEGGLFGVPGGFAFLVRLEQINQDGTPLPGTFRFFQGRIAPRNLAEYVADLIVGRPGYFRAIAFVVTDESNFGSSNAALPDYAAGGTILPESLAAEIFKTKNAYVLVYAFERAVGGRVRPYDLLSATRHLDASGILVHLTVQ
jgi:hypothetical protein